MAERVSMWPDWPQVSRQTESLTMEALRSGRWAISELSNGRQPFVRRAESAFAHMVGSRFAVMTTSGTSAITLALESLSIEHGSEVLVPGLTWIACASAVLNAGLRPVLVDVEAETMCMSVDAAAAATTPRTAAVLLVHYMNNHAATDAFVNFCSKRNLALIEDCAQAHGAVERGKHVGLRGDVGVFSFQASKMLTCGEGGALVTNDRTLAHRAEQYRADGRAFPAADPAAGESDLVEVGEVLGRNMCMSEISAAVLLGAISEFPQLQVKRAAGAARLDESLVGLASASPTPAAEGTDIRSFYRYTVHIDPEIAAALPVREMATQLKKLTGVPVELLHEPLNANRMYRPDKQSRYKWAWPLSGDELDPSGYELPVATALFNTVLTFSHQVLLAKNESLDRLAECIGQMTGEKPHA